MHQPFPMMTSELDLFYADQAAAHRRAAVERMRPRRERQSARIAAAGLAIAALGFSVSGGWVAAAGASGSGPCDTATGYVPACQMMSGRPDGWFGPTP